MILHSSFKLRERRKFNKAYAATICSNTAIIAGNRPRCGIILTAALWTLCRHRHNVHSTVVVDDGARFVTAVPAPFRNLPLRAAVDAVLEAQAVR